MWLRHIFCPKCFKHEMNEGELVEFLILCLLASHSSSPDAYICTSVPYIENIFRPAGRTRHLWQCLHLVAAATITVADKQSQQNYRLIYWHPKRPISSPETIGIVRNWLDLMNGTSQFPKSKNSSKKGPKFGRGWKKLIKNWKIYFWIDLDDYCPIPPKKNKVIFSSPWKIIPSMPPKPRGHPPKKCHNLTGLQNSSLSTAPLATSNSQACHNITKGNGLGHTPITRSVCHMYITGHTAGKFSHTAPAPTNTAPVLTPQPRWQVFTTVCHETPWFW